MGLRRCLTLKSLNAPGGRPARAGLTLRTPVRIGFVAEEVCSFYYSKVPTFSPTFRFFRNTIFDSACARIIRSKFSAARARFIGDGYHDPA
jgi:hypothetical protein